MKFYSIFISLIVLQSVSCKGISSLSKNDKKHLRRTRKGGEHICRLLKREMEYEKPTVSDPKEIWDCEVEESDGNRTIKALNGLSKSWLDDNSQEVQSGVTTFALPVDTKMEEEAISLVNNTTPIILTSPVASKTIDTRVSGTKTVIAIRVKGTDASTTASISGVAAGLFGSSSDRVNFKERYEACSFNKVLINPFSGNINGVRITNGVVEVDIKRGVRGVDHATIRIAALKEATNKVGNLARFDHVIVCIPPGTKGGWVAYAYPNHYISVYNDKYCQSPSATVHEIGHNIGLAHSGEGALAYDDQSGMMGYSYSSTEEPKSCFNGAKSWQLGWYSDRHATINPLASTWSGQLVGVADYNRSFGRTVILKLVATPLSYFVHFNRATGINSGSREGRDQVLITTYQGSGYGASTLVGKLNAGREHVISNYNGSGKTVIVKVEKIQTNTSPGLADVKVFVTASAPGICQDSPPGWHDADGKDYNCQWYTSGDNCKLYGDSYRNPNNGKTANEACCDCGGGQ